MVTEHFACRQVLPARRDRSHEYLLRSQRVHPNSVTEQRAPGFAPRRVDGKHGNSHLRKTGQESIQQFIGYAALASTASTCDAYDRRLTRFHLPLFTQSRKLGRIESLRLDRRQHCGDVDCRI